MKQKPAASGSSLSDLATVAKAAGVTSKNALPKLKKSTLSDKVAIAELREGINQRVQDIVTYVKELAAAIADETHLTYGADEISASEEGLLEFLKQTTNDRARDEFLVAMVETMVASYPASSAALNHIANFGVQTGYFAKTNPSATKTNFVILPVTKPDGRWEATTLTSTKANAHTTIKRLVEISERIAAAKAEANRAAATALYKGAENLLDVLAKGTGEATFRSPDKIVGEGDNRRTFYGGTVRIRVADGKIFAVGSVGRCERRVKDIVAAKIFIPQNSAAIEDLRTIVNWRKTEKDAWVAMATLHGLVYRGYVHESAQAQETAAVKAMEAKASVTAQDFVLANAVGSAFFFMKKGWVTGRDKDAKTWKQVCFLAERNEAGEIRVADCPAHLEPLFASCREFRPAGEKFSGLSYPVNVMFRTLYGVFDKNRRQKDMQDIEAAMLQAPPETPTTDDNTSTPNPAEATNA